MMSTGTTLAAIAARGTANAAAASASPNRRPRHRPGPPEEVMFPVVPMLDMAFQLLAFFVLTFQAPSAETHIDLDLPVTPAAMPSSPRGQATTDEEKVDSDLENDLRVRVEANDLGELKALRLGDATMPDVATLGDRLRRYAEVLDGRPLRVRLVADDSLRYEVAVRVMAACSSAGVTGAPAHNLHRLTGGRAMTLTLTTLLMSVVALAADENSESGLSLSDLAPYRAALEKATNEAATPVTFRELWANPERYRGRRVRVEGRVVRRFRQGKFGTFPALAEVWVVTPAGDPFCLVSPASVENPAVPGASVRFEGTFLRQLRYQGTDTARVAPLIVGDRPPSVTISATRKPASGPKPPDGLGELERVIGLIVVSMLALVLVRRHVFEPSRRATRSRVEDGPAPEFIESS